MSATTDWIQTIAILVGLGLAANELYFRDNLSKQDKKRAVLELVQQTGNPDVTDAAKALIDHYHNKRPQADLLTVLVDLTPYTQLLQTVTFCYENRLCDQSLTRQYFCELLHSYEQNTVAILTRYRSEAARKVVEDRPLQRGAFWRDCIGHEAKV